MNIGLVHEYYPPHAPGGAEWSTVELAGALVKAGHSVTVITPGYDKSFVGARHEHGVRVVRFAFPCSLPPGQRSVPRRAHANLLFYLYSALQIARSARAGQLEVLHAQGAFSLPGTLWAARCRGIPAFFTLRDTTTICPITVCLLTYESVPEDCGWARYHRRCLSEFANCYSSPATGLRAGYRQVSFEAQWWDARLRRSCLARVDGVVAVSQGILEVYGRAGLVHPGRCRVIHNIAPGRRGEETRVAAWRTRILGEGAASESGAPRSSKVVLYVGKFSPGKGTEDLVVASDAVVEYVPEVKFVFAGKGTMGAAGPHVVNLGVLLHEDVLALYELADLVVVPSVWPEPLSRVILEAMAAGLPVIATRRGGSPELVEDGVTGLLVPRSHPAALASAIRELLLDGPRRRRMGQAAQQRAASEHNSGTVVERLVDYYLQNGV